MVFGLEGCESEPGGLCSGVAWGRYSWRGIVRAGGLVGAELVGLGGGFDKRLGGTIPPSIGEVLPVDGAGFS